MTNTDSQPGTGTHITSQVTTQEYADGGIVTSEAHTWTACPGSSIGETGCTLTLPASDPERAERLRGVLKHVDLNWLMRQRLVLDRTGDSYPA